MSVATHQRPANASAGWAREIAQAARGAAAGARS
jgi:hypothetical protein